MGVMCTMSWFTTPEGYELFFNRDERRARKPALPPAVREQGVVRYIAPLDGDFGGTWLGVNHRGLTLALLNGYVELDDLLRGPADEFTSRGLLLVSLIDSRSAEQLLRRLQREDLERFRSFHLLAFEPGGSQVMASWLRGKFRVARELEMPLVSSSFDTAEVCRTRRELLPAMRREPFAGPRELHLAYHRSHRPERGPSSVCMHRPEAQTVSFSRIAVDAAEVRFHYVPHAPCEGLAHGAPVRLARAE